MKLRRDNQFGVRMGSDFWGWQRLTREEGIGTGRDVLLAALERRIQACGRVWIPNAQRRERDEWVCHSGSFKANAGRTSVKPRCVAEEFWGGLRNVNGHPSENIGQSSDAA